MSQEAIFFEHLAEGERSSPIRLLFPEPSPGEQVTFSQQQRSGDGWLCRMLTATGIGCLLSYREYEVTKPVVFQSEVSEPVLALRIQACDESYNGIKASKEGQKIWKEDECRLFQLKGDVLETRLLPGSHVQWDVFIRPECLGNLAKLAPIKETLNKLAKDSLHHSYVYVADQALEYLVMTMFPHEILNRNKLSETRFRYLLDCVFAMVCGEQVEVEPAEEETKEPVVEEAAVNDPIPYVFKSEEKEILDDLAGVSRAELLSRLNSDRKELKEQKESWQEMETIMQFIRKVVAEEDQNTKWTSRGLFMHMARALENKANSSKLSKKERDAFKDNIVNCCEEAFKRGLPTAEDSEFFKKWIDRPMVSDGMGLSGFADILSMIMPSGQGDFEGVDDTPAGRRIFEEKLRENFGFQPMSHFTGETTNDKPQEVVALYQRLMGELSDTMAIDSENGIKKSDVIRELDNAYEHNDLTTLLQLEVKHLAKDEVYLAKQDDQQLRMYIMALATERKAYDKLLEKRKDDEVELMYLQKFHEVNFDPVAFQKEVALYKKKFDIEADALIEQFDSAVSTFPTGLLLNLLTDFIPLVARLK